MAKATEAEVQDRAWLGAAEWLKRHDELVNRKNALLDTPLVFLGDSITQGWLSTGQASWDRHFAPLKALNLGIGGDETQHVLWRIERGGLDGIAPKLLVLLIGTNNIGNSGMSGHDTAEGVKRVVNAIRAKLPETPILLVAVFPRDERPGTPFRGEVDTLNREIAALHDGGKIHFVDYSHRFLASDGTLPKRLFPDALHLSEEAYEIWAAAMKPRIDELMR